MDNKKLNEKLAKWANIHKLDTREGFVNDEKVFFISEPYPPDFTSSLDACFKWLVPKLNEAGYFIEITQDYPYWECIIEGNNEFYANSDLGESKDKSPALALCLAIEKLIEAEK